MLPQAAPEQPVPETLQLISGDGFDPGIGVSSAAKFVVEETVAEEGPLIASVNRLVILTANAAVFDGSAVLVAVTRTVAGDGSTWGAVKMPFGLIVPQAFAMHAAPLSAQLTVVLGLPAEATVA